MMAELVQFQRKNLKDIPAMLRHTAERIENGELGEVEALFVVAPIDGGWPRLLGFGAIDGQNDPLIQFQLLIHWLTTNLVSRDAT